MTSKRALDEERRIREAALACEQTLSALHVWRGRGGAWPVVARCSLLVRGCPNFALTAGRHVEAGQVQEVETLSYRTLDARDDSCLGAAHAETPAATVGESCIAGDAMLMAFEAL